MDLEVECGMCLFVLGMVLECLRGIVLLIKRI